MRPFGVVRKLDQLGRIVIPMELRKRYNIQTNDEIEIFVDGDTVVLRKYVPRCVFCQHATEDIQVYKGKNICPECWETIQEHRA